MGAMTCPPSIAAAVLALAQSQAFATVTAPASLVRVTADADAIVVATVVASTPATGGMTVSVLVTRSIEGPLPPGSVTTVHWATRRSLSLGPDGPSLWFLAWEGDGWAPLPANVNPLSLAEVVLPLPPGDLAPEYEYAPTDPPLDKVVSELWGAIGAGPAVTVEVAAYRALLTVAVSTVPADHGHRAASGCMLGRFLDEWGPRLSARVARHTADGTRPPPDLVSALGRVDDPRAVPDLARILAAPDTGPGAVRGAARALRNVHSEEALPYLRRMLDHADASVRYSGLAGLASSANGDPLGSHPSARPGRVPDAETHGKFPSWPLFLAHEEEYLGFWREWYDRRHRGARGAAAPLP